MRIVITGASGNGASTTSPALRPRTMVSELAALVRRGNIDTRPLP